MLILNILTHDEWIGNEYASDRLYVCDASFIISETRLSHIESGDQNTKRFDSIVMLFEEELLDHLTIFLQNSQGILLWQCCRIQDGYLHLQVGGVLQTCQVDQNITLFQRMQFLLLIYFISLDFNTL